LIVKKQKPC